MARPMPPPGGASLDDALTRSIDALEREFRCAICMEHYDDPHYLSACKHVFCKTCCLTALEQADMCPVCRVKATRRSVKPDEFMARLVKDVQEPRTALNAGQNLVLPHPMPEEWSGKAPAVSTEPYVMRSAQPMELREILRLHEKIKAGAERAAMVNAQTARVVATAKAAANNAAKDRDVALPLGAIDEAAAAMPSSEAMAAAPIAALPSSTAAVAASSASIRRSSRTQQPAAPVGDEAMARILQQEEQRGSRRAGGASSDAAPAGVSHRSAASRRPPLRAAEATEAAVGEDVEAGEQDDEGDAAAEAGEEEDGSCAVCGGNESYGDDAIVFCDGCDVGMHQTCYGIHPVPEGQWFCESCAARRPKKGAKSAQPSAGKAVERSCPLCPVRTGAFKRTLDDVAGGWAHACCVLFHEGPGFTENVPAHGDICFLRKPAGFDRVSQGLCKLKCAYCASPEDKAAGAKRQCGHGKCATAFHVTCALANGCYVDCNTLKVYCKAHSSIARRASEQEGEDHTSQAASTAAPAAAPSRKAPNKRRKKNW